MQERPLLTGSPLRGLAPRPALAHAAHTAAAGARRADAERALSQDTVEALTAARLPAHFVPSRWGGDEGTFTSLLADVSLLAQGCASAGWCAALWAAHGRFGAYLPPEGQHEIWQSSPDVRIAAAITPPTGTAEPASNGWNVSGTWRQASGVTHSSWVLVAAVEKAGEGREVRVFAIPRRQVTISDTWDGAGLCATASHTITVRDTHVPDRRTFALADMIAGVGATGRARCHTVPAHLAGGLIFCATALGTAHRAMDLWSQWATEKSTADGRPRTDAAGVRETFALASAHIDAAGLLLERCARRADTFPVSDALVAGSQRDAAAAARMLVGAVDRLFRTGSHILHAQGELQRAWRDVHTISAHAALRVENVAAAFAAVSGTGRG